MRRKRVKTRTPGNPPVILSFFALALTIIGFIFSAYIHYPSLQQILTSLGLPGLPNYDMAGRPSTLHLPFE